MERKIQQLQEKDLELWNNFIQNHPFASPLQLWEWGEVKKNSVWQPIRLVIKEENRIIAGAQILKRKLPLGFQIFYCPHGPVINWAEPQSLQIFQEMIGYLQQNFTSPTNLFCRFEPYRDQEYPSLEKNLKPYFKSIQPRHTSILTITEPEKMISQMSSNARYNVRLAAREGVIIYHNQNPNEKWWKEFYRIYQDKAENTFVARPWRQFQNILQKMAFQGKADLYLAILPPERINRKKELPETLTHQVPEKSQIIAGAIVLQTKENAGYIWGASQLNHETRKLKAPYLLQWEIIKKLYQSGIKTYDLWGIAPTDDPEHSWSGHTAFKKSFGGKNIKLMGAQDLPLSPLYPIYRSLDYLRQRIYQPDIIE